MMLLMLAWLAAAPVLEPGPSVLLQRGYHVTPSPQRVKLGEGSVEFGPQWRLEARDRRARRALVEDLKAFHGWVLKEGPGKGPVVEVRVDAGAVEGGDPQAYRLKVAPGRIEIRGNGEAGAFYGVQTLLQLLGRGGRLPECEIEDWPRLKWRFLHWDSQHHQDRPETLRRYLDWAARFKVNRIAFELEDKFAFPSHPVIGAPGAFTPAELQALVDYGLERHIQIVPLVQSPGHFSYVLKHAEFAHLRADGNNYQADTCQEAALKLMFDMYDDLIAATKGVDSLFVSTDEFYYAGIGENCKLPYTPESRSAAWVDFARRAHEHLAKRGRQMLAWVEYPVLARDVAKLPPEIIDGVVGEEEFLAVEARIGMKNLIYTSIQGSELLFPDVFRIESSAVDAQFSEFESAYPPGRLQGTFRELNSSPGTRGRPVGSFIAAWDDSGLHGETFWLGWSAGAAWSWNKAGPSAAEHAAAFFAQYLGGPVEGMARVYGELQGQARAWQRSWDRVESRVRGPGYGNSEGKGIGTVRKDLTLELPPLPGTEGRLRPAFRVRYQTLLEEARRRVVENARLENELTALVGRVERNRYHVEVLVALTRFIGHHWRLLLALGEAEGALERREYEKAARMVEEARAEGEEVARQLTVVFEKERFAKGRTVDGRAFVQVFDDVKDRWAGRTADLGYMFAPERGMRLEMWSAAVRGLDPAGGGAVQ